MEKIYLGWEMSNTLTDPPLVIMYAIAAIPASVVLSSALLWPLLGFMAIIIGPSLCAAAAWAWYQYSYMQDGPAPIDKYVDFKDSAAQARWSGRRIPITELCELYLRGHISFRQDLLQVLRDHRNDFVNYKLTWSTFRFLLLQFFPNSENSSMKHMQATKKEIAEHYDRGNDWFASFLGPRMIYTSAVFEGLDQSLEEAQDNKMSLICEKLMVRKGDKLLDIGCGWGALACHAAKHYEAESTGVTLSVEGARYCREQAQAAGLEDQVRFLCVDYRQIPKEMRFDKVVSVEMAEHVGLKNFQMYLHNIREMLSDDGLFLMQVAGIRQGAGWEEIQWGLFMSRYIFPGADASTPLHWYVRQLEMAGFEVRSAEGIGCHYSHTLHRWYDNFQRNRADMVKAYGDYLCRLWDMFLAWSVLSARVGYGCCYQILAHKNLRDYPRDKFCQKKASRGPVN
uniref:sphingolipid C(9)-methyltransferase n=1 Tax=Pyrodinium bahamense TaxID=73915 RepID=A0A7S0AVD5_9DINO